MHHSKGFVSFDGVTERVHPVKAGALIAFLVGSLILYVMIIRGGPGSTEPLPGAGQCHVHLSDFTDPPTSIQLASFRQSVAHDVETLPLGACIVLARLHPSDLIEVVFESVRPPRGEEVSRLTANPERVEERYQKEFHAPLMAALDQLAESKPSDTTPLLEALHALDQHNSIAAACSWQLDYWGDALQHTELVSHYRCECVADLEGNAYVEDMAAYQRASVRFHRLRAANPKYRRHQPASDQCWAAFFEKIGVADFELVRL